MLPFRERLVKRTPHQAALAPSLRQFEAWLSFQMATKDGLVGSAENKLRCSIECLHETPGTLKLMLMHTWRVCDARKAVELLSDKSVTVTNQSDNEVQLPKILALDDMARSVSVEAVTRARQRLQAFDLMQALTDAKAADEATVMAVASWCAAQEPAVESRSALIERELIEQLLSDVTLGSQQRIRLRGLLQPSAGGFAKQLVTDRGGGGARLPLADRVQRLRIELALDAALPMAEVVKQANEQMQLPPDGGLSQQVDALMDAMGIS